jgi:hypothetical protein
MDKYIKSFVVGSSWPVFILFFLIVSSYGNKINVSYPLYSFGAPLFLGLLNMFGLYISNQCGLTKSQRFLITGTIGALVVSIVITLFKIYNYTRDQFIEHYLKLFIFYIFMFGFVVNAIESSFC